MEPAPKQRSLSCSEWKALTYKSLAIYKTTYFATLLDVLWPVIIILVVAKLNYEPTPPPSNYPPHLPNPQINSRDRLRGYQDRTPPPPLTDDILRTRRSLEPLSTDGTGDGSKPRFDGSDESFMEPTLRLQQMEQKNNSSNDDAENTEQSFENGRHLGSMDPHRKVLTLSYSCVVILCFMGIWSGASSLAHVERMSGTVERMRMYGVSDFKIVCSYLIHAGIKQLISSILFSILLTIKIFNAPPLIANIDVFSIFISMWLLCLHSTAYFLAVASFFNSSILRGIVGTVSFLYLFVRASKVDFTVVSLVFGSTFPPFSTFIMMGIAYGLELNGGMTWKSLISAVDGVNDIPLLAVFVLMLIGTILLLLIFFYMLNVKPGPYGSARPFYFILPQSLHLKLSSILKYERFSKSNSDTDTNFRKGLYEKVSSNVQVGIKIENLYKKFGNISSVKNMSMNVYSGQITALLGHNGAGKTTTLSILAGMLSPTSGSAFYAGYNIFDDLKRFRKNLGLCPQSDLLHPNLKVIDHLVFFGMLNGMSRKDAYDSGNNLLRVVGIYEKKYVKVKALSGGMKRKLCIALSLLGDKKVVILDEPTSGVDPESRREIWNVLLEARGERIMLITTHFMEEADALGDQIAIMNHGEIVCYGSPMFLKKHYGAGFQVSASCRPEYFSKVVHIFKTIIPEASVISEQKEWIKLKLPFQKAGSFPELFRSLESDENVARIGVSCTTMEDVYLKVQEEVGGDISTIPSPPRVNVKQTGESANFMDYINRFSGLILKNFYCSLSKWIITLIIIVVIPAAASYMALGDYNTRFDDYQRNNENRRKRSYVAGSKHQDTAEGIDEMTLLNELLDNAPSCHQEPYLFIRVTLFTFLFSMVIFITSSTFSKFPHDERVSSVKHLVLMTGISPITYWMSTLLWDMIIFFIFALVSAITYLIIDSDELFERDSGIYVLFLIIYLSGVSMIASIYFVTLLFKTMRGVIFCYFTVLFSLGYISYFFALMKSAKPYLTILKLQPLTATMLALNNFMTLTGQKHDCKKCPYVGCEEILSSKYFNDELRNDILFLAGDFILYMVLVILADYRLFSFIWNMIQTLTSRRINNSELRTVDSDVAKERNRVEAACNHADKDQEPMVIVDGLAKKYSSSMVAVYDVTFGVSKGECFGLLGVNGAGKTTTFNMLTGMFYQTEGNVFLKGFSLKKNKSKCLSLIGYCPQHSALVESLTGRQMLAMFARLRLIPSKDISSEVDRWINLFGLDEYCDRKCGTYSGGNKRKLNTALAFIGDPSVILLDEPTTGVDPFIRRNLWGVIDACATTNQAIIISSHSMDECEAVCDRLTIMVKGRMECIGNTQHLKAIYGTGYVILIKLKSHTQVELTDLKDKMQLAFSSHCQLKDEHHVLLHYHLDTNIYKLSQLFSFMERVKRESIIVDDYIINDSSLEEVFLSFAKRQGQ